MGGRRLATPQADDTSKQPRNHQHTNNGGNRNNKQNNTVLANTQTRRGEVFRAQRRTSDDVNARASQHVINVPVNKSIYNGYGGRQFSAADQKKQPRAPGPRLRVIPIGGLGEMGIGKTTLVKEGTGAQLGKDLKFKVAALSAERVAGTYTIGAT